MSEADLGVKALRHLGNYLMGKGLIDYCYIESAQVNENPQVDACDYQTYYFLKTSWVAAIARISANCAFMYVKEPYLSNISDKEKAEMFGKNGHVEDWDYNSYCLVRNTGIPQESYEV